MTDKTSCVQDKKDWALRYLHWCNVAENAEKGEINDLAQAEEQLNEEFKELNEEFFGQ